jgi:hypothetical protein
MYTSCAFVLVRDNSRANCLSVDFGEAGWLRFTSTRGTWLPDPEANLPSVRRDVLAARAILEQMALLPCVAGLAPRVEARGDDMTPEQRDFLREFVEASWRELVVAPQTLTQPPPQTLMQSPLTQSPPPQTLTQPPPPPPPQTLTQSPPQTLTRAPLTLTQAPLTRAPSQSPRAPTHFAAPYTSPPPPQFAPQFPPPQVDKLVGIIRAHIKQYRAAPDFNSELPAARARAYNYIRSTAASPNASDELVEQVRLALCA